MAAPCRHTEPVSGGTAPERADLFLGIDLGWTTGWTGVAAVDDTGRLIASNRVRTDDEIAGWIQDQSGHVVVAAVDAPLIVPNETGQRVPETLIARTFGAFGASPHTSNRRKFGGEQPRALRLAERFGWTVDPETPTGEDGTVCIEVYPHPAMVGLFELGYRLDYKKGNDERRGPGFADLAGHLEAVEALDLAGSARWQQIRRTIASPMRGDLNRVEDEIDAILCAHLAWLWRHRREAFHVYGSATDGYIVAPPPPSHRPVRPTAAPRPSQSTEALHTFERQVSGRPTGYSSGEHERRWKENVASAFSGCSLPADARVQLQMDFLLGPEQAGNNEPDLDNLIKSTIDAFIGVIGARPRYSGPKQADDVRVDRITAAKRHVKEGEDPGAHIWVAPIR